MKEHLINCGADDIDGLVAELYELAKRMEKLHERLFDDPVKDGVNKAQKRLWFKLQKQRDELLIALNDALAYIRLTDKV